VSARAEGNEYHGRSSCRAQSKESAVRFRINQSTVELIQGDIVGQDVDAIVNAANSSLSGGGGVDGAIHRAAGPELLAECRTLGGCPTGAARITKGYRLKARHVIHAVGPVYQRREQDAELLASAYRNSLELSARHGLKTIAFPAISTGIYGYPLDLAAPIALQTVKQYLEQHPEITLVRFVLWDTVALKAYERAGKDIFMSRE
jgi:O-acetyl-ADP-ribose deacetylase (regulator of RNase III)